MNWISPTGLRPCAAMPTHSPLINSSASGVSITRSAPNRCCSPTVARKTPPLTPTSSPSTTTLASSSMARASARLTASTSVTSAIGASAEFRPLAGVGSREFGVEMVEHRLWRARRGRQIALDRRLDLLLAVGRELFLLRFAPRLLTYEIGAQARDRLLPPARLNLRGRTVTPRVIGGRVIAEAVGHGLDQARPTTGAGLRDRILRRGAHRDDVVAVHLLAGKARGDRLLRQRLRRRLQLKRYRDRPLIVVGDEHHGQLVHPGEVHRLPHVALGGSAVTEEANRNARLFSELECVGDAGGVRRLGCDRDAVWKIVGGAGGKIAALIAAPEQQNFLHLGPPPQQRAVVPVGGKHDVLLPHGTGDADRNRLLAERNGVGAEPPRALQRDGFEIKGAGQHHAAIKGDEDAAVGGKARERSQDRAVRREIAAAAHLEPCNDGKLFVGHCFLSLGFDDSARLAATGRPPPRHCNGGFAIKLRDSAHANKLLGGGAERAAGAVGRGQTRPNAPFLRLK